MTEGKPLVSVIVPAHNEERTIGRILAALQAQTLPAHSFEVIVMDDRSSDRTQEIASTFLAKLNLRIEQLVSGSIAEVRNRGAMLARAEVLAFLDADCVPRPNFLTTSLLLAAEQTLWGAHYLIPPDSTWVGRVWAQFQGRQQRGSTSFLPGGTLLVHHVDFTRIGGFQQGLETSEDVELCQRAHHIYGMQVIAHPELAVFHYGTPQNLAAFYRQNRWHGKHVLRAFLDRPSLQTARLIALSLYTLIAFWLGLLVLTAGLLSMHWWMSAYAFLPLLLAPASLTLIRIVQARSLAEAPALAALYLVYLLARAAALVQSPQRGRRA